MSDTDDRDEQIRLIAAQARRWAELLVVEHDEAPSALRGFCARAAVKLATLLKAAGFQPEIVMAQGAYASHVFVIVDDKIVDVTATQFGAQAIVVIDRTAVHEWWWIPSKTWPDIEELREHQLLKGWPEHQVIHPSDYEATHAPAQTAIQV